MRAEGTAGKDPYNVVLGNGRYGLPSKPLTSMTLAEAYAFGRTVRARHGSSSAIGAFQIVGKTMKGFMGEAGLGWDSKFSPENQRKLADVIRKHQGLGAWEGFKVHPGERAKAMYGGRNVPGDAAVGTRQGIGPVSPKVSADLAEHLVRGLDGKLGIDLGNGIMKMPNGAFRSITSGGAMPTLSPPPLTAPPPPRQREKQPIMVDLHMDGRKMGRALAQHIAEDHHFPTKAGGMDTHGEWRAPGTPVSDAA